MKKIGLLQKTLTLQRVALGTTTLLGLLLFTPPAQAGFHLWTLREVYTDASGTLQFIEMNDTTGFQNATAGQQIQVRNLAGTQTNIFTVPSSLGGSTANKSLLFGTAGLASAGGPTPDFLIPNNFLFAAGGTITFFGLNSGPYAALPTDGILSRTWTGGNAVNSPQNYSGQTGVVPEPGVWSLFAAGLTFVGLATRRRAC